MTLVSMFDIYHFTFAEASIVFVKGEDGKKALMDKGKYVVVWEKRNSEWKLYRDIGSTSMPAK